MSSSTEQSAVVQQPQWPYSVKLESTKSGIRMSTHVYGPDPLNDAAREKVVSEAVQVMLDLIDKLKSNGLAPEISQETLRSAAEVVRGNKQEAAGAAESVTKAQVADVKQFKPTSETKTNTELAERQYAPKSDPHPNIPCLCKGLMKWVGADLQYQCQKNPTHKAIMCPQCNKSVMDYSHEDSAYICRLVECGNYVLNAT